HPLADCLVVQGVVDRVAGGRDAVVERHLDVEYQRLADPPLPVVDTDQRVDLQAFDEYLVHCDSVSVMRGRHTAGSVAMSQREVTITEAFSFWPACSRSAPAKAIIAPLSVQNSGRGKHTRPPRRSAICSSFARRLRLAPTPPATTRVSQSAASSARSHLIARVSTTAS